MQRTPIETVRREFRGYSEILANHAFLESLTILPLDRVQAIRASMGPDDYAQMVYRDRAPLRGGAHRTGNGGSGQALTPMTPEEATRLCELRGLPPVRRPYPYGPRSEYVAAMRARGLLPR